MRDRFHICCLPGLTGKAFELVQQGNLLADWTATIATAAHGAGAWLVIEHPTRSLLWAMEKMKQVHALAGVVCIQMSFGNLGAGYVKPTHLLSNMRDLWWIESVAFAPLVDGPITLRVERRCVRAGIDIHCLPISAFLCFVFGRDRVGRSQAVGP